jgi:hypothetical protein
VAIDVLLAFLRPGYSLIYNAESDYGRGPWFWVMDLNFLLRCALSLAIAGALYRVVRADGRVRWGLALLVTWAICSGLLAFFADDVEGTPQRGSGIVHLVLAFIAFTCIAIGTILISASLLADPAWRPAARVLLVISIAGALAYLLLGTAHHHAPGGLYERIFLGLELLWIAVAAVQTGAASGLPSLSWRVRRVRATFVVVDRVRAQASAPQPSLVLTDRVHQRPELGGPDVAEQPPELGGPGLVEQLERKAHHPPRFLALAGVRISPLRYAKEPVWLISVIGHRSTPKWSLLRYPVAGRCNLLRRDRYLTRSSNSAVPSTPSA